MAALGQRRLRRRHRARASTSSSSSRPPATSCRSTRRPATIESGQTPVVIDWDYLNVAQGAKLKGKIDWKTVVPPNAVVGGYYVQAINKDAPHPAAARLWQEFLYSDEGQNLWLKGGARRSAPTPCKAGTIDKAAYARPAQGRRARRCSSPRRRPTRPTDYLKANWAKAVG